MTRSSPCSGSISVICCKRGRVDAALSIAQMPKSAATERGCSNDRLVLPLAAECAFPPMISGVALPIAWSGRRATGRGFHARPVREPAVSGSAFGAQTPYGVAG